MSRRRLPGVAIALAATTAVACEVTYIEIGSNLGDTGASTTTSSSGATLCSPGTTASCYHGPPGTAGTGICKAGTMTCSADGMSWSACAGEVWPKPPDCASGMDLHCDGKVPACDGSLLWAKRFGSVSTKLPVDLPWDYGSMAIDGAGGIVLAGYFDGAVSFGGGPVTSHGGGDSFVVKLDGSGQHVWSTSFGGDANSFTFVRGVAVDASGDVFLTGHFYGSVDFGGGVLASPGADAIFVVKIDGSGHHVWSKKFGDSGEQQGLGVTSDHAGSIVVTGMLTGSADFGGGPLTSAGGREVFVVKLDGADGHHQWSLRSGGSLGNYPDTDAILSVASDSAHSVIVGGTFVAPLDFGGGPLTNSGGWDVFLAKLDPKGQHVWSKSFASAGTGWKPTSIGVDPMGAVLVTGAFSKSINFGGSSDVLTNAGTFVAKMDTNGQHVWSKRFGDMGYSAGWGVASDPGGNVLLAGAFEGSIDFGDSPLLSSVEDAFLVKRTPANGHVWSKRFGTATGNVQGIRAMADTDGNVFVIGACQSGPVDFGAGPLAGSDGQDVFVAKFAP